jgi:Flp pilus assembly protein TadD
MAKKNKGKKLPSSGGKGFGSSASQLKTGLLQVEKSLKHDNYDKAESLLDELKEKYPNSIDVLKFYLEYYTKINDYLNQEEICEQILEIDPNSQSVLLHLANSYLYNSRAVAALSTLRTYLEKYPQANMAPEIKNNIAKIEQELEGWIADSGLSGEPRAEEILTLQDKGQSLIERGHYDRGRELFEEILQICPTYVRALNHLAQSYYREENSEAALATAREAIALDPNNFHAQGNITQFLYLQGKCEEAQTELNKLLKMESEHPEFLLKVVETLSYFGDNKTILEIADRLKAEESFYDREQPMFYHLVAVAALREGRETEARQYWQKSLDLSPHNELVSSNLRDANRPISDRHAPWPFPISNWIYRKAFNDLTSLIQGRDLDDETTKAEIAQSYFQQHPEIEKIVPILLDRGSPEAREFAMMSISMLQTPNLLERLREFVFSNRGPDRMRLNGSQILIDRQILKHRQSVRLWIQGKWQDIVLQSLTIDYEPRISHEPHIQELLEKAVLALKNNQGVKGEKLLKQALQYAPDAPDILYNLAGSYQVQDRGEEAEKLIREIYQNHPDYLMGRLGLANLELLNNRIKEAKVLLESILEVEEFHIFEYTTYCQISINLALQEKDFTAAKSCLKMWRDVDDNNPKIDSYQKRIDLYEELAELIEEEDDLDAEDIFLNRIEEGSLFQDD